MRALKPLLRRLQRSLRAVLLRRVLAWLACAVILIVPGGALAQLFGNAGVVRLGLILAAFSALPAFLLWPPAAKVLTERLRRLDEGMVFEAYLEAEPSQVRDLLRSLAVERAAALAILQPPREPLLAGLGWLFATAISCSVLVEMGFFLILGRPLTLSAERPPAGTRIEEQGFSDFATEAPDARQSRRARLMNQEDRASNRGENPALGRANEAAERVAALRRAPNPDADHSGAGHPAMKESLAKRKQGDAEEDGAMGEPSSSVASSGAPSGAPGRATGEESQKRSEPGGTPKPFGTAQGESASPDLPGAPTTPGRTGQGYEHTADTKVPSPLLDYRSQFEARFAERTGRHISVSGRMGFGELRDFQRRYFESLNLHAEIGAADDPYVSLLKRRWSELKGGTW